MVTVPVDDKFSFTEPFENLQMYEQSMRQLVKDMDEHLAEEEGGDALKINVPKSTVKKLEFSCRYSSCGRVPAKIFKNNFCL
jgi:hypothetical protein